MPLMKSTVIETNSEVGRVLKGITMRICACFCKDDFT